MAFVERHPETVSGFNKNEVAKITKGKIRQEKQWKAVGEDVAFR